MDPVQNNLSDNIDFSKVRIHVKTPKERFIFFCGKWKNCFILTFFILLCAILVIVLASINTKLNNEKTKKDKLPIEITRLKNEIQTYANEIKDLNSVIKSLNTEHLGLTNLKTQLQNDIIRFKTNIQKTDDAIDFNNKEINQLTEQLKTINSTIEKNSPLYNEKMDEFLKLKKEFLSLGGKEEDIPTGAENKTIQGSKIITTEEQINTLQSWLGNKKIKEACYKTSVSGISIDEFHQRCNNKGATITIVKTDDNEILGGFTELSWVGDKLPKNDPNAFLFNLNNKKQIKVRNTSSAIFGDDDYFVIFGRDFRVTDFGVCYSGFPMDYGDSNSKQTDFSKSTKFLVIELETYTIQ